METKTKINQYRERLDKTLASPELIELDKLKAQLKNQHIHSSDDQIEEYSEDVLRRKATEVYNFLEALRSASVNDCDTSKTSEASHGEWKLKQDNEEFRVMYREGPQGTPFHTFLFEGYVDAPVDACLCVSWETGLYRKWWPQYSFPPFKVLACKCLKRVRDGEQVSLVRVKGAWPLSAREGLVHYFLSEYFQGDLVIVLNNTIADPNSIDKSIHGFTNEGIPEANDAVRIGFVGGFAIQKVTSQRSYFRTLANIDMKLDFVPPSLINFITRQLVGSGFKLYQKATTSATPGSEDYGKALKEPMYARIRKALYSKNELCEDLLEKTIKEKTPVESIDHVAESLEKHGKTNSNFTDGKVFCEIEEEEESENKIELGMVDNETHQQQSSNSVLEEEDCAKDGKKNISIRPEVEQALGMLEKAISILRDRRVHSKSKSARNFAKAEVPFTMSCSEDDSTISFEESVAGSNADALIVASVNKSSHESKSTSDIHEPSKSVSSSFAMEIIGTRIVPALPEQNRSVQEKTGQNTLCSNRDGTRVTPFSDQTTANDKQIIAGANDGQKDPIRRKNHRYCCFRIGSKSWV